MGKPYARIVLMHLTVIFTVFLAVSFRISTTIGAVLLIGSKILVDLRAHRKEHALQ